MENSARIPLPRLGACLLSGCLLAACSGIRPYADRHEHNLQLHTRTESGALLSRVHAAVDIYGVDDRCETAYQGTVNLDRPAAAIGLPVDRPSYLVFGFTRSSWLAGSRSTVHYATLLTPRSGHVYDIEASYLDAIYRVRILESASHSGGRREVGQRRLSDCVTR